jgi:hypothetical protein
MNPHRAFLRKVVYVVAIGVLLFPLYWLGHPATSASKEGKGRSGGVLAQLRQEHHITQADLGQVDLTNETVKLVTLGMRGIAADVLWWKAGKYQMKKDWTNLSDTLEQITKVQPNFIEPWRFQAWNLSYNVSVSFDLPPEKYAWLIRGVRFLQDGVWHNDREPRLLIDIAWFISYKLGRDDPWRQYRRLFKEDDDFNKGLPPEKRDNWLVGKTWYETTEELVKRLNVKSVKGTSLLLLYSYRPRCQMDYADALEKDGVFGERARLAWKKGANEWFEYGARIIPSPPPDDATVCLNNKELHDENAQKLMDQLESLSPGLSAKIVAERLAALTPQERKARNTPAPKRTPKQVQWASDAEEKIQITPHTVAMRISGPKHVEAMELARKIDDERRESANIACDRGIVNFDYWKLRAEIEQTDDMRAARMFLYKADEANANEDLDPARKNYELGFQAWRKVLDRYPQLKETPTTPLDINDVVQRYRKLLKKRDEPFPKSFILQDIIDIARKR